LIKRFKHSKPELEEFFVPSQNLMFLKNKAFIKPLDEIKKKNSNQ